MNSIIPTDNLTHNQVANYEDARRLLNQVAATLPIRPYDESWKGATDYYDPMVRMDLNVEQGFTSIDPTGRVLVVLPGRKGNMIFFDRFGHRTGPVVVNGFAMDIVSSWDGNLKACSGWRVDNDQFAEQLLKRLAGAPAYDIKRSYKARLENTGDNAEGLETYKVILSSDGFTVAELSISLKPLTEHTAVIMDGAKFHGQHPLMGSMLCLLGMEAFLSLHPVTFLPMRMYYNEGLLLQVAGSIGLVCEKSEDVPGAYMAWESDHQTLMDAVVHNGFELDTK